MITGAKVNVNCAVYLHIKNKNEKNFTFSCFDSKRPPVCTLLDCKNTKNNRKLMRKSIILDGK